MQSIVQEGRFKLVEEAADKIVTELEKNFPQMKKLYLNIKKPEILKNALVGVEILRKF
jgi:dihydroneopterin aldolase